MKTKELIKEMKKYRDVHSEEQVIYLSYQLSHKMFNEIIKRLEELDTLKAYLHKDVLDEVERLEAKRR